MQPEAKVNISPAFLQLSDLPNIAADILRCVAECFSSRGDIPRARALAQNARRQFRADNDNVSVTAAYLSDKNASCAQKRIA